jgi:hypothetical protein
VAAVQWTGFDSADRTEVLSLIKMPSGGRSAAGKAEIVE